ncbi:MAG: hypothetical protein AAGF79_02610 [Pseudomonadota bacterium]
MRRLAALCLLTLSLAASAAAGPWLRDPRVSFLSVQSTPRSTGQVENGVFAERGITPHLTLGVDFNDNATSGHALVFARFPISQDNWVAAVDVALGAHHYEYRYAPMARIQFGIGRSIEIAGQPGWAAISLGPEWRQGNDGSAWKADGVLGLKADRAVNPILSVETYLSPTREFYWSVIPGALVRGRKPGRTWLFGVEQKGGPVDMSTGLRIGYWIDF